MSHPGLTRDAILCSKGGLQLSRPSAEHTASVRTMCNTAACAVQAAVVLGAAAPMQHCDCALWLCCARATLWLCAVQGVLWMLTATALMHPAGYPAATAKMGSANMALP